jgi:hypothetical protein
MCDRTRCDSRRSGSRSNVGAAIITGERATASMLIDHVPLCPWSWYVIWLHNCLVDVLKKCVSEIGAEMKGRDLQLEMRHMRFGFSHVIPRDWTFLGLAGIRQWMLQSLVVARTLVFRLWAPP